MAHARRLSVQVALLLVLTGLACGPALAEEDKGETKELRALKSRTATPKAGDIDTAATLEALLAKTGPNDWSTAKAAMLTGVVVQVEREEDGDYHIVLAPAGSETDTKKWVIVEATPGWRKKVKGLSEKKLRQLRGKEVRVTGWLFCEPEGDEPDPRGTRWELHPVTDIMTVK